MKQMNVGILGLTQVSKVFAEQLLKSSKEESFKINLSCITDKYAQAYKPENVVWGSSEDEIILASNIDIVVICTTGLNNAYIQARNALEAGKNVVTNNQTLIAVHGQKLWRLAQDKAVHLRFEAAVLGGVPVVDSLFNSYGGSKISRVTGVLNSTCNYVLMRMKDMGCTMQEALSDACELNYTEEDPELDVSGKDSLYKLAILKTAAFGEWNDITKKNVVGIKGIEQIDIKLAQKFGCNIKLLGTATANSISVAPTLLEEVSQLGNTNGTLTGVIVDSNNIGPVFMSGHGSDEQAIASALMSDITAIATQKNLLVLRPQTAAYVSNHLSRYYVRVPEDCGEKIKQAKHIQIIEQKSLHTNEINYDAYIVETGLKREELTEFIAGYDSVTTTCVLNIEK